MNALPYIDIQWDESGEDPATFLRYNVYRRVAGVTAWTRIARIQKRDVTQYSDYNAWSGVTYEYAVTVVKAADTGEEIESDFPVPPPSAILYCRSTFIHVVDSPGTYTELLQMTSTENVMQEQVFLQPRNKQAPIMHVGQAENRQVQFSTVAEWEGDMERYNLLRNLFTLQRTGGALLVIRGYRIGGMFAQITSLPRNDSMVVYGLQFTAQEVYYSEAV